ncbi:hypothetical protein [Sulfitobacter geojensis]|uniref:hypothetical protein n=1 Tax=Sulfitobacter geojensis TaxID=1342299 RepID=UPI0036D8D2F0
MQHEAQDWKQHYKAMKRWKDRAIEASQGISKRESVGWLIDSTTADDFGRAYFIWAHSLRDWLIKSETVEQKKLDDLLFDQDAWKNVRDFANKTKHSIITQNPKDPNWISGMSIDANALLRGEHGVEPYVYIGGRLINFGEAVLEVDKMWECVLAELGLSGASK